jgi:phage head maturation protease
MPYSKQRNHPGCPADKPVAVIKEDGKLMGCHANEEDANAQIAALWAAEQKAKNTSRLKQHFGKKMVGESLQERINRVYAAIWQLVELSPVFYDIYPLEVFEEYVIVEYKDSCFLVPYTVDVESGGILPAPLEDWVPVVHRWVPISTNGYGFPMKSNPTPIMAAYGGQIKALGSGRIGGYLVAFTNPQNPDLAGEYFDAQTFFDYADGDRFTFFYQHGADPVIGTRALGSATSHMDDVGIWVEGQLALRDKYERAIYELVEKGKLGFSSGALSYLIEYEEVGNGVRRIKSWPLGRDATLTPTPMAGPYLTRVAPAKSLAEATPRLSELIASEGLLTEDVGDTSKVQGDDDSQALALAQALLETSIDILELDMWEEQDK